LPSRPAPPCCWSTSAPRRRRPPARCAATWPSSCPIPTWCRSPGWCGGRCCTGWCCRCARRGWRGNTPGSGWKAVRRWRCIRSAWPHGCRGCCRRCWSTTRCATPSRRGQRLLFSFHGLPQRLVDGGDPYAAQCQASVAAIARALGLDPSGYAMSYQSRFGRERWLGPATDATVRALAAEGVRELDVVCPGFATDCLETLEEIAIENAQLFREAGGSRLRYIPCLNDAPDHAAALAAIVRRELAAWDRAG